MWIVAKVKNRNFNVFKESFSEKMGRDVQFYHPKIEFHKYLGNKIKRFEKYILENYIFCYHENFKKSSFIAENKFLKGLEYFLEGHIESQLSIIKFIEYCKTFENERGYLTQLFFKTIIKKKAKFISGPFANMIFEILERKKNNLKILIGNVVTTIPNKKNYLYRPV